MPSWLTLDWHGMFVPSKPILETVIRGSVTYLMMFLLLRLFRRQTGSVGPADLLVLLLIADASQNAMAHEYRAITDGVILVATIIAWEYALDYLGFRFPKIGRLLEREPLQIIRDGRVDRRALDREFVSNDELLSRLREKGIDRIESVSKAFIEGDGKISVILKGEPTATPISDEESDKH